MKDPIIVPLEDIKKGPYASILCYPRVTEEELERRLKELEIQGVTAIEFAGKGNAFNIPILGKGNVGLVVIAHRYSQRLALKIRRSDADRADLLHEGKMLAKANSVSVGPILIEASKNFLLTQLIEGDFLPEWLGSTKERNILRQVLSELMEECWQLDNVGMDHGELSNAPKHVIIDSCNQPWIVDFETSSEQRKAANVTAICQYLIMSGGSVSKTVSKALGERNCNKIIDAIKCYKKEKTRMSLDRLIQACLY